MNFTHCYAVHEQFFLMCSPRKFPCGFIHKRHFVLLRMVRGGDMDSVGMKERVIWTVWV